MPSLASVKLPATYRAISFKLIAFAPEIAVSVPPVQTGRNRHHAHCRTFRAQPFIVAERRSRPHSHDLTIKLFAEAGLQPRIAQYAEEKQTIVNLVAADLGIAIVPRWTSRMAARGVCYVPLQASAMIKLPLAAAWPRGSRDPVRDEMLGMVQECLSRYARAA